MNNPVSKINHNGTHYLFFWNGIYSNWYPSEFTIDDITYNCGEQYMMYQKAMLFKDNKTAELILKTDEPREQKSLGRKVKDFDPNKWSEVNIDLMV